MFGSQLVSSFSDSLEQPMNDVLKTKLLTNVLDMAGLENTLMINCIKASVDHYETPESRL